METRETLKTKGFGVFGKYTDGKTSDLNFFKNQPVTCPGTKWTYSPLKYWPTQGRIDFLAYAPYKEGQTLKENTTTHENTTTFDFTVAKKAADQIDLLWANATGKITENFEGTTKEKVNFHFYHALSRLGYTVKLSGNYTSDNATFTLKKITLAGSSTDATKGAFYETGTIDLSKATKDPNLWSGQTGRQKFDWFSGDYQVKSSTASHPGSDIEKEKDYLFVIPQNFSENIGTVEQPVDNPDKLYVIVEYDVTYNGGTTIKNKVYKQLTTNFEQGKAYMLNLTIGLPIEFDIDVENVNSVEPWEEVNGVPGNIDSWDDINREQ